MSKVLFFLFLIILFYLFNLCYKGAKPKTPTPYSRAKVRKIIETSKYQGRFSNRWLEKFLSCYSSSAPNSLAISSDFLICSIKVWRHMLSSRKSASSFLMSSSGLVAMAVRSKSMLSISLRRRFRVPIYQKTTLSDRTLQLKGLLPEEPLLYATMSIGSQVATHFVLLVFFEQIASFFLYFWFHFPPWTISPKIAAIRWQIYKEISRIPHFLYIKVWRIQRKLVILLERMDF